MKCLACGIEKDVSILETYPYEELYQAEPITPIFIGLECKCDDGTIRLVNVCHECFHKLQPDMWISEKCWESISPITEVVELEIKSPCLNCESFSLYHDCDDPEILPPDRLLKTKLNCDYYLCGDERGPCPILKQKEETE